MVSELPIILDINNRGSLSWSKKLSQFPNRLFLEQFSDLTIKTNTIRMLPIRCNYHSFIGHLYFTTNISGRKFPKKKKKRKPSCVNARGILSTPHNRPGSLMWGGVGGGGYQRPGTRDQERNMGPETMGCPPQWTRETDACQNITFPSYYVCRRGGGGGEM